MANKIQYEDLEKAFSPNTMNNVEMIMRLAVYGMFAWAVAQTPNTRILLVPLGICLVWDIVHFFTRRRKSTSA